MAGVQDQVEERRTKVLAGYCIQRPTGDPDTDGRVPLGGAGEVWHRQTFEPVVRVGRQLRLVGDKPGDATRQTAGIADGGGQRIAALDDLPRRALEAGKAATSREHGVAR